MSVWGKAAGGGAWADHVEEEEAAGTLVAPTSAFPALGVKEDDFPDLAAAAKVKETRKDKKKKATKQVLSLNEFLKSDVGGGGPLLGAGRRGGDVDILSLPTAPRPRAEGEERPDRPLGGGFREYGGREGGRRFDDERRPRRGEEEDMGPSRAEMSDNWGADRKFAASEDRGRGGFGGGFRERDGGFRDRSREGLDGPSRADEVDDWGKSKQFVPSGSRGFDDRSRGGFDDRPRGGFRERSPGFREPSRADTEDRWSKASGADFKPTAFEDRSRRELDDRLPRRGFGFGDRPGSRDASRDRWERTAPRDGSRDARPHSRDISAEPTWRRAGPALSPSSPPRERPRLNLAPRSAAAPAATTPAGASKASVFGAARPREEVLREQGRDAVKEDLALEHEAVDRPETAEERALRAEITNLQVRVEAGEADAEYEAEGGEEADGEGEEAAAARTVGQALEDLEGRLARLQLELDTQAKYARAAPEGGETRPRAREPSPAEASWRRPASSSNGGPAPRGFREDKSAREERAPRSRVVEDRGRRDNFPPRDSDAGRGSARW